MLTTTRYEIYSPKIDSNLDGTRIVLITDLHNHSFGPGNCELLRLVEKEEPELIAVTGDVLNFGRNDGHVFEDLAKGLAKLSPVYFTGGNHELMLRLKRPTGYRFFELKLRDAGVHILSNKTEVFARGAGQMAVSGLELPRRYYGPGFRKEKKGAAELSADDIRKALGCASEAFQLLLVHTPFYFKGYAGWGADLSLAGHVHGGHVRIPGLGGLLSPDFTFFPLYDQGVFVCNGAQMVVGRGLGSNMKPRINCPPELVAITLRTGGTHFTR